MSVETSGSPAEFIATRRLGPCTVTVIREGDIRWEPDVRRGDGSPVPLDLWRGVVPSADERGGASIPCNCVLIRVDDVLAVVDPCFGEATEDGPWPEYGLQRTAGREAAFRLLGIAPEHVTHVLLSHLHGDHIDGCTIVRNGERAPRYPRARYVLQRQEWEPARGSDDPLGLASRHLLAVEAHGQLDLIDGDVEIGSGLWVRHRPGESRGHAIVEVTAGAHAFFHLTDLFHFACEVEHQDWAPRGVDIVTARRSRGLVCKSVEAAHALCTFGHAGPPCFGHIERAGNGYAWRWETMPGDSQPR